MWLLSRIMSSAKVRYRHTLSLSLLSFTYILLSLTNYFLYHP